LKGYGGFFVPLEFVGLPEEFEEGQAFVAEPADESA